MGTKERRNPGPYVPSVTGAEYSTPQYQHYIIKSIRPWTAYCRNFTPEFGNIRRAVMIFARRGRFVKIWASRGDGRPFGCSVHEDGRFLCISAHRPLLGSWTSSNRSGEPYEPCWIGRWEKAHAPNREEIRRLGARITHQVGLRHGSPERLHASSLVGETAVRRPSWACHIAFPGRSARGREWP